MAVYSNVKWNRYFNLKNPTINSYLRKYGNSFIEQTFNRICLAHKTKKSQIILIRFRDSDIVSILESKDYIKALEMLLALCIKIEYYEMCSDIQIQIRKMKGRKRKVMERKIRV
jgi:hypothetical protein